jgi:hemoglobin
MEYYESTLYELIGGGETIRRLVEAFYSRVAVHPDLKPIFPEDFTEVKEKQYKFLTQFFGGPPLYSNEYGHPMLRARHLNFPVTPTRVKAWLSCMSGAMDEIGLEGPYRDAMFERLKMTAHHMMNTPEEKEAT